MVNSFIICKSYYHKTNIQAGYHIQHTGIRARIRLSVKCSRLENALPFNICCAISLSQTTQNLLYLDKSTECDNLKIYISAQIRLLIVINFCSNRLEGHVSETNPECELSKAVALLAYYSHEQLQKSRTPK